MWKYITIIQAVNSKFFQQFVHFLIVHIVSLGPLFDGYIA